MKIDDVIEALGKQADSEQVQKLMKEFDLGERVIIKRGETDTYLSNYEKGISLLFESERYIHSKYEIEMPTDAPVLVSIFLYGNDHDKFSPYQGTLTNDLQFSDGQNEARVKLGPSEEYDEDFNSEIWNFPPNIRLYLDYSDDRKYILLAQYGIVFK